MLLSESEKKAVRVAFGSNPSLGLLGRAIMTLWVAASFIGANHVAEFVFLAFRYGISRVVREHIHVVPTPHANKYDPWILSNGDLITHADKFGVLPITIILWMVCIVIGYLGVKYCSNKMKRAQLEKVLNAG
jgi:hypothetical protein